MDTQEKTRETARSKKQSQEAARSRKQSQERKKRPADQAAVKKKSSAKEEQRRRRTAQTQPEQRRQRTQEQRTRQHTQEQQPRQRAQQTVQYREPLNDNRNTTQSASVQRPARSARPAAPQGTGQRMSAPQMSAMESAELRRQQRRQAAIQASQPAEEKKNALQNFISGVRGGATSEDAAARAEQRRKERAARAEKKRRQAEKNDTPAIIYTQPIAFSRDRLLIQLLTVTAVVAAVVLGMSVFFKVETITVAGAETYSAWAIREASGISEGDSLLTFSKPKASAKIQAELAYVGDVRIGIKLPDTVIIYIEEMDVAYAMESTQGDWWLINSDGRVVEQITSNEANNHTQVLGVRLQDPQQGSNAVAADEVPQETLASGEPVPLTVTGAQRLSSALQILKALEANDIVGQAASVDVTSLDDVTLWYGSRYEVLLGDTSQMEYKIACMNDAILELSEYQSGILDISFDIWTDEVGYTPFG